MAESVETGGAAAGVQLVGPCLITTATGEVEAGKGDWLCITEGGQVVMSDAEYRARGEAPATEMREPLANTSARDSVPIASPPARTKKKNVLGSLFGKRKPVHAVNIAKPSEIEEAKCQEIPPSSDQMPVECEELEQSIETAAPVDVSIPINSYQIDTSSNVMISGMIVPELGDICHDLEPENEISTMIPAETCHDPADIRHEPKVMTKDMPERHNPVIPQDVPVVLPATRPPIPSKPYGPIANLEALVIPKRKEGEFRAFMRPGPVKPKKVPAKKGKKKPAMVLPFQRKKAATEPKRERCQWVPVKWI